MIASVLPVALAGFRKAALTWAARWNFDKALKGCWILLLMLALAVLIRVWKRVEAQIVTLAAMVWEKVF